jgi:hypothetical protein
MSPNKLKQQFQAIPIPSNIRQRSQLGIEQAIMDQKEGNPRKIKSVKRRVGTIVAAFALLFLSAALMNHNYVWAAIQKALQFVPGIGIVKEEDSPPERYVLKKPISLSVGEGSIIITGILSDEEMTYITMMGNHTPRFENVTLVNAQGVEYTLRSSMASWSQTDWTSGFWYNGKLDASGSIKLVINLEPRIEVPVTLTRAETYSSYSEMGETATTNGISITALPDRVGEKARVSLVARHSEDFFVSDYGIYGVYMHDESHKLNVVDDTGRRFEIENVRGISSPAREFYFKLSENARNRYTLTLPEISVTYKSEVSIKISTEAQEHINQTFEIAGFPVTITKTEKVKENGFRVYMDFHYNEQAAASLYKLDIDGLSSGAKLNERTGAIEYIEFEVEPGSKQVNLKLIRPEVIIRGPWQFEFSDGNFKVGE